MSEVANPVLFPGTGTDTNYQYVRYITYNKGDTPANITIDMPDVSIMNTLQSLVLQV
jgi:hypothetical protein